MSLSTLPLQHQKEKKLKKINSMNATVILSAVMAMATSVASVSNFAWKIQCKMPPKTKKILPPANIQ